MNLHSHGPAVKKTGDAMVIGTMVPEYVPFGTFEGQGPGTSPCAKSSNKRLLVLQAGDAGRVRTSLILFVLIRKDQNSPMRLFFLSPQKPFAFAGPPELLRPYLSSRQAMPGSSKPSRNSREAPPPVEMWVILSAKPSCSQAAAESPPPTMVTASESARA